MFNDRDLAILGAGALLGVACLLLPLPLAVKAVLGTFVLAGAGCLALLRLGPDRIPFEAWLLRRLRFSLRPRRLTYLRQPEHIRPVHRILARIGEVDFVPGLAAALVLEIVLWLVEGMGW